MNIILIWNLFWDCRSVAVVSLLTPGQHEWSRNEKLITWRTVWFSCVCLYRVESDGNKLLTNLSYHCIASGIDILYFAFVIGLVIIICGIIVDVCVRFTMSMVALVSSNTSFGSTFIASVSIFHPRYIFGNCPCSMKPYSSQIWRISTSNWHIAQARYRWWTLLARSQRSPLTSQLLSVWLAVSNAHYPVLSRKPSESVKTKISTAHISKTKTNFSKIHSKLFSGLQNIVIEINLSRRFSWPLKCPGVRLLWGALGVTNQRCLFHSNSSRSSGLIKSSTFSAEIPR